MATGTLKLTSRSAAVGVLSGAAGVSQIGPAEMTAGMRIELDYGDGLEVVPLCDIDGEISVDGSFDGIIGTRSGRFTLNSRALAPLKNALLRGMPRVRITGIQGLYPYFVEEELLDGYVRDDAFDVRVTSSTVNVQDSSIKHVDKPLYYDLPRGAGKTRLEIIREVCCDPDILTNGGFASDLSGWTAGANWAWNAGAAKHTAGSTATLAQNVTAINGQQYRIYVTITGRTAGSVVITLGAVALSIGGSTAITATGEEYLTAAAGGTLAFTITPTSDFDGSIAAIALRPVSIPLGTVDLPNVHGGYVYKSKSHGGEIRIIDFLAELAGAIGCRLYWRSNALHIASFDASGDAVRTLGGELRSLSIDPPPSNGVNVASVTAGIYEYVGPEGSEVTVTTVTTPGPYTPAVAVQVQDHVWGTVTDVTPSSAEEAVQKQVITTEYKTNGTLVRRIVETKEWHAPQVCRRVRVIDRTGIVSTFTTHNPVIDCYKFGDGSWRTVEREIYGTTSVVDTVFGFDADGKEQVELTETSAPHWYPQPIAEYNLTTGAEKPANRYNWTPSTSDLSGPASVSPVAVTGPGTARYDATFVDDDGNAWGDNHGWYRVADHAATTDGVQHTIKETTFTQKTWSGSDLAATQVSVWNPYETLSVRPLDPDGLPWNVWGDTFYPVALPTFPYTSARGGSRLYKFGSNHPTGGEVPPLAVGINAVFVVNGTPLFGWSETYVDIDGSSYTLTVTHESGTYSLTRAQLLAATPDAGATVVTGTIPTQKTLTLNGDPQPATVTVKDSVRVALSGREIVDARDNDHCETDGELTLAAKEHLRDVAHHVVGADIPVDFTLREGDVVAIDHPDFAYGVRKVIVWAPSWSVSGDGSNAMRVTARLYPGEMA